MYLRLSGGHWLPCCLPQRLCHSVLAFLHPAEHTHVLTAEEAGMLHEAFHGFINVFTPLALISIHHFAFISIVSFNIQPGVMACLIIFQPSRQCSNIDSSEKVNCSTYCTFSAAAIQICFDKNVDSFSPHRFFYLLYNIYCMNGTQ